MKILNHIECQSISAGMNTACRLGASVSLCVIGLGIFWYTSSNYEAIKESLPQDDVFYGISIAGLLFTPAVILVSSLFVLDGLPNNGAPGRILP